MQKPDNINSNEGVLDDCTGHARRILSKLRQSIEGGSDIIFGLISSTVWQSPFELAHLWITRVAKEEWLQLADNPSDEIDIRNIKLAMRKFLHYNIMSILIDIYKSPTTIQKVTTRLLVSEQLTAQLPTHDKDRVLASAIMLPYKRWKQVLGVLSHLDLPDDTRLAGIPNMELDEKGEDMLTIQFHGGGKSNIESIPGVICEEKILPKVQPFQGGMIFSLTPINTIKVTTTVMSRFDGIIADTEKETHIRKVILYPYLQLPVLKKRSFGGSKQVNKEVPEGKLAWNNN